MSEELAMLLEAAQRHFFSSEEKEEQRRSFVYGNTHIENSRITRELVDEQAELLAKEK